MTARSSYLCVYSSHDNLLDAELMDLELEIDNDEEIPSYLTNADIPSDLALPSVPSAQPAVPVANVAGAGS